MNIFYKILKKIHGCPDDDELITFALEGLEEGGRARARAHLDKCPPCLEQLRRYRDCVEGLALSAPQVDPPADLKDCVFRKLFSAQEVSLHEKREGDEGDEDEESSRGPWFRLTVLCAALLALGCLVLGIKLASLQSRIRHLEGGQSHTLVSLQNAMSQADRIMTLMSRPEAVSVYLVGMQSDDSRDENSCCSGRLVLDPAEKQALLILKNLRPAPFGSVYVLWIMAHGAKRNAAAFNTGNLDPAVVMVNLKEAPSAGEKDLAFAVTRENSPAGGEQPAGDLVMLGKTKP